MRYAALLRGVSPMNATMPGLVRAFEAAGFVDVKTVLGTGNVLFTAPKAREATLEKKAEAAMAKTLERSFMTTVRAVDELRALLAADPWTRLDAAKGAKRVVSFLRAAPTPAPKLPVGRDNAVIHALIGREVFTSYTPHPKGPVFMVLLGQVFGEGITTRTWETVGKIAK